MLNQGNMKGKDPYDSTDAFSNQERTPHAHYHEHAMRLTAFI